MAGTKDRMDWIKTQILIIEPTFQGKTKMLDEMAKSTLPKLYMVVYPATAVPAEPMAVGL